MSMRDLLLQLSQISSTLYQQTSPPDELTDGLGFGILDFLLPFPELALDVPSPDSLTDILVGAGAPPSLARELSEIHARRATELAENYSQNYRNSCIEIASRKSEAEDTSRMKMYLRLQRADRQLYYQTVEAWEKDVLQVVKSRSKINLEKRPAASRSAFNSDFTHVLDAIFKENPFPSPAVKKALADKSGMSVNQIKIWFQNHRSRARKEGLDIPKTNSERRKPKIATQNDNDLSSLSSSPLPRACDDASTSKRSKGRSGGPYTTVLSPEPPTVKPLPEPPNFHPSPVTSVDFLPSLSFPFTSSSASSYSQSTSPSSSIRTLANDGLLSSLDLCQPSDSILTRPLSGCETSTVTDSDSDEEDGHKILSSRSSSVTLVDETDYSLSCKAPYYAFPTRYPPHIDEDPFPCRAHSDFSFPKPAWPRAPCTTSAPYSTTDVAVLIDAFSRLTLEVPNDKATSSEVLDCRSLTTTSASPIRTSYPIITHTYSAPLPFLIRHLHLQQTTSGTGAVAISATRTSPFPTCASEKHKFILTNLRAPGRVDAADVPLRTNAAGANLDGPSPHTRHVLGNETDTLSAKSSRTRAPDAALPSISVALENEASTFRPSDSDSLFSWGFEEIFSTLPGFAVAPPLAV